MILENKLGIVDQQPVQILPRKQGGILWPFQEGADIVAHGLHV